MAEGEIGSSREQLMNPVVAGEATVNSKRFLFGTTEQTPSLSTAFSLLYTESNRPLASTDIVSVRLRAIREAGQIGVKYPVYGDIPKPKNTKELARYMMTKAGFNEPPIVATRTFLNEDNELSRALNQEGSQGLIPNTWGWELTVSNSAKQDVLDKLGISQEQLYESETAEREKRLQRALEIVSDNPDVRATQDPEKAAEILDRENMRLAPQGEVRVTNQSTLDAIKTKK